MSQRLPSASSALPGYRTLPTKDDIKSLELVLIEGN